MTDRTEVGGLLRELADQPPPPSRLEPGALYTAGRRRYRIAVLLRVVAGCAAVAVVVTAGPSLVAHLGAPPVSGFDAQVPVVSAQPPGACASQLTQAAGQLSRLPAAGDWHAGFADDCAKVYIRLTAQTPVMTVWMVFTATPGDPGPASCAGSACQQTAVGPLTWGTRTGGLYRVSPPLIADGLTWADLHRSADGTRLSLRQWYTYDSGTDPPTRPYPPSQVAQALVRAGQQLTPD